MRESKENPSAKMKHLQLFSHKDLLQPVCLAVTLWKTWQVDKPIGHMTCCLVLISSETSFLPLWLSPYWQDVTSSNPFYVSKWLHLRFRFSSSPQGRSESFTLWFRDLMNFENNLKKIIRQLQHLLFWGYKCSKGAEVGAPSREAKRKTSSIKSSDQPKWTTTWTIITRRFNVFHVSYLFRFML